MFQSASWLAKVVRVFLAVASVWNVAVLLEKSLAMRRAERRADRFIRRVRTCWIRTSSAMFDLKRGGAAR
jgi:biopolymer transport protein ExbB/TolQ